MPFFMVFARWVYLGGVSLDDADLARPLSGASFLSAEPSRGVGTQFAILIFRVNAPKRSAAA